MKVEWMMFANHAEEQGGLLFLSGATWDTINVNSPILGLPPGAEAVTAINGSLVIRLLFHRTETGRQHAFRLTLMDQDGAELPLQMEGQVDVAWNDDNPPEWDQGVNIIIGLTGMLLPRYTTYSFHLLVDGNHVAERPFRVLQHFTES